jgi:7,8-dihydropterin-6-yl-methyl-4-(beta-D-ribofuranosyl)aminobenzene 5'-phosphate synthase
MYVRIAYDNEAKEGFRADWGFSCLIETAAGTLLFDTGASADVLSYNLGQLGVQSAQIDRIVLSHEHRDHTGGLAAVLQHDAVVYVPQSFTRNLKTAIAREAAELVEISAPHEILPGIHTTGELGSGIREQSLVLETPRGVVVVTGCAHPGLENILAAAAGYGELYGVIGGFHGFAQLELLRAVDVIAPCHCTAQKRAIHTRFPEQSVRCGAGTVIELP